MGAGNSVEEILLNVWNNLPEEAIYMLIGKVAEVVISKGIKLVKKRRKIRDKEKLFIEQNYNFITDKTEVIDVKKSKIKVKIYKNSNKKTEV